MEGKQEKHFIRLIFFAVFLCCGLIVSAQGDTGNLSGKMTLSSLKPLNIGDKVPDISFTMVNYPKRTVRLSDFKGKLIIIDFWATWCGSCIGKMPDILKLQNNFGKQVQFILVNSTNSLDNSVKIDAFFKKWTTKGFNRLSSAVEDSLADRLFPHRYLPHYVWITPEGRVNAITSSAEITSSNITKVLKEQGINLPLKKDFFIEQPMYLKEGVSINDLAYYSVLLKGKLGGGVLDDERRIDGNLRGHAIRNVPILEIYRRAMRSINEEFGWNSKRMMLQVSDPSKLAYDLTKPKSTSWETENLYSYDLIVPEADSGNVYTYMLQDLNRYSPYYGSIEKRKVPCLLLVKKGNGDKTRTKGGEQVEESLSSEGRYRFLNTPISSIINGLNRIEQLPLLIIDDTHIAGNVDIEFNITSENILAVKTELQRYELDLVEGEIELEMFVLKEK